MIAADVITKTRGYIKDNFLYTRPDATVGEHDMLLEKGIVDSMGMVELLMFINETFDVEPADDEITEANFGSLSRIASFVAAKRGRVAA